MSMSRQKLLKKDRGNYGLILWVIDLNDLNYLAQFVAIARFCVKREFEKIVGKKKII